MSNNMNTLWFTVMFAAALGCPTIGQVLMIFCHFRECDATGNLAHLQVDFVVRVCLRCQMRTR
jgi:hypothetical protein